MWTSYGNGSTIGTVGSEGGDTVKDDELNNDARVTVENNRDGYAYAITIRVYGLFVHTVFCNKEDYAKLFNSIKKDIEIFLKDLVLHEGTGELIEKFINKYRINKGGSYNEN